MVRPKRIAAALLAVALLAAAGCSGRSGSETENSSSGDTVVADFGDLSGVCQDGDASGAPTQGVTDSEITVGVFSDVGYSKNPEFVDAAKVFTSWCNAAGGINGRTLTTEVHDSKLMAVRQKMVEACRTDFALVGGGSGLDGLGVKERLECTLPDFPAQVSQQQNLGTDLQVIASQSTYAHYDPYNASRQWLTKEAYPQSAGAIGIINGDSPVTKVLGAKAVESLEAMGAKVIYNELYPVGGVTDWTPYAQAIKNSGVRGLIWLGEDGPLAKLEEKLTSMDYKLDWIDPTNNAFQPDYIELLGRSAGFQNNIVDLGGVVPLQLAAESPAMQQLQDLYEQYAPDAEISLPATRAFSAWLLFAKAASACGSELTRTCVVETAKKETEWTGGGLHSPNDLSAEDPAPSCFNAMRATPEGWQPAEFGANDGLFRCGTPPYRYTGDYGEPLTLADVGKTMADVE
ncbi:ABC transporter substrate-binding protein [Nocardia carnea]|uniref:ABC transporter substrate-binding protein n=1 Tax=Nocardia carnea TaxID=37328 RepID=UPI0024554CEF|nr:ABC transporter substrate-binding protein [Nocardia carnea]